MSYPVPLSLSVMMKSFVILLLSLPSFSAWAFYGSLQTLSSPVFTGLVTLVLIVILGLTISVIVLKFRIKARERAVLESNQQRQRVQEQIDRSASGIIQLDDAGTILYANPEGSPRICH